MHYLEVGTSRRFTLESSAQTFADFKAGGSVLCRKVVTFSVPTGSGVHSPPSSAETKKAWGYTSIRLHGLVLS